MISWQAERFLLLLLFIISITASAHAEMITGTVVTVEREKGIFYLRTDRQQEIQVRTRLFQLPKRLIPGRQVRVWGDFSRDNTVFAATDIRGAGKNRHHDQTGVRARIGNGKYCLKSKDETLRKNCRNHNNEKYRREADRTETHDDNKMSPE
jgi:hypothetical protein